MKLMLHWLHLKGLSPETRPTGPTVGTLLPAATFCDNIPSIYQPKTGLVVPLHKPARRNGEV